MIVIGNYVYYWEVPMGMGNSFRQVTSKACLCVVHKSLIVNCLISLSKLQL